MHDACEAVHSASSQAESGGLCTTQLTILEQVTSHTILVACFKPCIERTMLSLAVAVLILGVVAGVLLLSGSAERPSWLARGLCLLLLTLCIVAAYFA